LIIPNSPPRLIKRWTWSSGCAVPPTPISAKTALVGGPGFGTGLARFSIYRNGG
jgi:hypothetical protein